MSAPTHHLTLTRSAQEIIDLHRKLTSAHPDLSLPHIPLALLQSQAQAQTQTQDENGENGFFGVGASRGGGATEKKRKSSFLHTLSRLASPGPNRRERERPRDMKVLSTSASANANASGVPSSRNSVASTTNENKNGNGNSTVLPSPPSTVPSLPTPVSSPGRDSDWDPFALPVGLPPAAAPVPTLSLAPGLATTASTITAATTATASTTATTATTGTATTTTNTGTGTGTGLGMGITSEANSTACTALAGYLTTLSNEPALKHSKAWRRFVRVRTDDLISERVERAVKRVRSDLAAHLSGVMRQQHQVQQPVTPITPTAAVDQQRRSIISEGSRVQSGVIGEEHEQEQELEPSVGDLGAGGDGLGTGVIEEIKEEEEEEVRRAESASGEGEQQNGDAGLEQPGTPRPGDSLARGSLEVPLVIPKAGSMSASTGSNETAAVGVGSANAMTMMASRIPRSQSADPDKATRMSRLFQSSSPMKTDGEESALESESEAQMETETEVEEVVSSTLDDDSSISTSGPSNNNIINNNNNNGHNGKRKKAASASSGAVLLRKERKKKAKASRKVIIDDFEMMRVLGKGCAGKVLLVRHKKSESLYALKAITKRHVLAHQELLHTLTEQAVLKRMAREAKDPFVVKLWWSFHDKENLYLVMDFHPGGDLATQLARWGRLGRDRARFYAAEIVEGVDGLHAAGVIYRDLKPENILIGADGHIVLTDFGLSKEFPRRGGVNNTAPVTPLRPDGEPGWGTGSGVSVASGSGGGGGQGIDTTTTFCGTAEYLAPEVIQGLPYSYEVDWWSFGTMLYEMLTGIVS